MLMKTPPALLDSKTGTGTADSHLRVTPVLWFVIGTLAWALFVGAAVKYGVAISEVMN
jgi:hypothetical protein